MKKLLGERSEWEAEVARAKEELRSRLQSQATQCELDSTVVYVLFVVCRLGTI